MSVVEGEKTKEASFLSYLFTRTVIYWFIILKYNELILLSVFLI